MEKQIVFYQTQSGKCSYLDWYSKLDKSVRLRIDKRIEKLKTGHYGDHKPLQKSKLSELRMDFGKGYRIYYYDHKGTFILFLAGSEKKDQQQVIKQCNNFLNDFIERETNYVE